MDLRARWDDPWLALGLEPPPPARRDALLARWAEPHRAYHTAAHLADCLALLDEVRDAAARPAELEIALWYHDAVYDPAAGDNEAASAALAVADLAAAGAAPALQARVAGLVRQTDHRAGPSDPDAALLLDVDLAVLGAPADRYDAYARRIREEYRAVPEPVFRRERAAVLRRFLERPVLYASPVLRARLEGRARANLARELAALAPGG
jgi:predicted metal-dependent HD superfamily phosphohydrolase